MLNCLKIFKKKDNIQTIKLSSYGKYDLNNVEGKFYVESVYDGDTITLLIPTKLSIYDMCSSNTIDLNTDTNKFNKIILNKVRVRLYGVDTPELKPKKNLPDREAHIVKAKEARDFLSNMILNKLVKVKFLQNDKYGRPLVKLYANDVEGNEILLNDLMIKKGFANKYDGKTKDSNFTDLDDNN
jgi:endonuclease YncB( thermonuclease family)